MSDLFGDVSGIATAIGILGHDDWFSRPDHYLARILADPAQRGALLGVLGDLLGEGDDGATTDGTRTRAKLFDAPPVALFALIDEVNGGANVDVSLAVSVHPERSAGGAGIRVDLEVPIVRTAGSQPAPANPLLLGPNLHGVIRVNVRVDLPEGTDAGAISLGAAESGVTIPTDGTLPGLTLALRGLKMPGAAEATDVIVDAADLAHLDDALLQLVLGLVQAQSSSLQPDDPVRGLAGLLGLVRADAVPDFPIAQLIDQGPSALAQWWAEALSGPGAADWFGHLKTLLGAGSVDTVDGVMGVECDLGADLTLRVGVRVTPGAGGLPAVTPVLGIHATPKPWADLGLDVEPITLDLSSGAAIALPSLRITATLTGDGGDLAHIANVPGIGLVRLKSVRAGFALDADHRPTLVLTALDADVGAESHYDSLDLRNGDALAAVAAGAVTTAAATLVGDIPVIGGVLTTLVGLSGPAPHVDPGRLLTDPIAAVRDRWAALLAGPPATVRTVLETLRDAVAADAVKALPVVGTGTVADPYRVPLTAGVDLRATVADGRLSVVVAGQIAHDLPPSTRARLVLDVHAGLLTADLDATHPSASFLTGLAGALTVAPTDGAPLSLTSGDLTLSTQALGARVRWTPAAGVDVTPWATAPALAVAGHTVDLAGLSTAGVLGGGQDLLAYARAEASAWADGLAAALEQLLAGALSSALADARAAGAQALAGALDPDALAALIELVGWGQAAAPADLSLAGLVHDPAAELTRWLAANLGIDVATRTVSNPTALAVGIRRVVTALGLELPAVPGVPDGADLTTLVSAATGAASGLRDDPLAVALPGVALLASFAGADATRVASRITGPFAGWTPGAPLPDPADLLAAIGVDAAIDPALRDVLAGRAPDAGMIEGLVSRWAGTDGVVGVAESALPAGLDLHRVAGLVHGAPLRGPEVTAALTATLGAAPARVVLIAVEADGEPTLLAPAGGDAGVALEIDLTAAGSPPDAFDLPTAAPVGVTVVRLGGKAACAAGATDGFHGQVARLARVLGALAPTGVDVTVVAGGAAGRPAVEAASGTGVTRVVTVGTPWSPLALSDVDVAPVAEGLRMLRALAGLTEGAPAPNAAAARGIALVDALLHRDGRGDPLTELAAPTLPLPAALTVTAMIGTVTADEVREAITALVRHALDSRALARAAAAAVEDAANILGVRVPLEWGDQAGGIRAKLETDLDLAALAANALGGAAAPRTARFRLQLWADARWLVGGPDPARSVAPRPFALRAATIEATVPMPGSTAPASARLVLHEASVYGVSRSRWVIDLGETGALLPEVRALLSELAAELAGRAEAPVGADPAARTVLRLLRAVGLVAADGGFDATSLTSLISDPVGTVTAAVTAPARVAELAAALRDAAGDTRADAGATVRITVAGADGIAAEVTADLTARSLTAHLVGGSASGSGMTVDVEVSGAEVTATAHLRIGAGWGVVLGLTVGAGGEGVHVTAGLALDAYGLEPLPLWPSPVDSAERIADLAFDLARDAVLRIGAEGVRAALAVAPAARSTIDAVLDAAGLLAPAGGDGTRALRWPRGLLADPAGWIRDTAGGLPAALPALLDAAAGAIGAPVTGGTLRVTNGVELRAASAGGTLHVGLSVNPVAFGGVAPDLRLGVELGVDVRPDGPTLPRGTLTVGATPGALAVSVGTGSGGADAAVGVTVELRPSGGAVISLYPGGPGISRAAGAVAQAGAVAALPALLNAVVASDPVGAPAGAAQIAARIVARLGVGLGLADDGGAGHVSFSAPRMATFVAGPAAALEAACLALPTQMFALLVEAIDALTGVSTGVDVDGTGGSIRLTVGPADTRVSLTWNPGARTVGVGVTTSAIPVIGRVHGEVAVSAAGLQSLTVVVGPVPLVVGGVSLRPFARFGWLPSGATVDVGLTAGDTTRVLARFTLGPTGLAVVVAAESGMFDLPHLEADALALARAIVTAVLEIAVDVVLRVDEVAALLALPVGAGTYGDLLDGVVLDGTHLDVTLLDDLSDPMKLIGRLARAIAAIGEALPPITLGPLTLNLLADHTGGSTALGVHLGIAGGEWVVNPAGDVRVSLVADAEWIAAGADGGLDLPVVTLHADGSVQFTPSVAVRGVGVRLSRSSGPLLDAGLRIDAVSVLAYGEVTTTGDVGGGAKIALEGIGLNLGSASGDGAGGGNGVAKSVMPSGGSGENAPQPAFSPSLAILKHPGAPGISLEVRAGTSPGPWWLTVQRSFGPIYLEQVGLNVEAAHGSIASISVLIDGRVSLFGFAASVDDLSLTYFANKGSALSPASWAVDVAGFAISAQTSGLTLVGGLRKFSTPRPGSDPDVEYLGMLQARFAAYGLAVYGGFGELTDDQGRYLSMFLIGGVNGPIGGVPAFFVTGIAGGFGVNRQLKIPTDLNEFPAFPLIGVLNTGAVSDDPMGQIAAMRGQFPAARGSFWFAAGLSFNSFVLVDGIVMVAVEFGDGFEIAILGLARMALPRPEAVLVSIELALVARVSSREGLILVQAQLTDNSWLLSPSVRLTGGFAFASWFAGPLKGQFVLTIGGYHPDFHREGYPVVPRLGIEWSIGDAVVIKGQSYFALTSEALMAGVRIEIRAELGPAWAHIVLGADAIIYFDPFWLSATVYASIDAGITIDLWFATITLSVHIGASVTLTGPKFHAIATLEIGPASVTFEIGGPEQKPLLKWSDFVEKYLEQASESVARALSASTSTGTVVPAGAASKGGASAPDGQPDRPFKVIAEFDATIVSTIPLAAYRGSPVTGTKALGGDGTYPLAGAPNMAIAPMGANNLAPRLTVSIRKRTDGRPDPGDPENYASRAGVTGTFTVGDFPVGVWGPVPTVATVPKGDLLRAANALALSARAQIHGHPDTPEIPYRQVECDARRILPLLPSASAAQRTALRGETDALADALGRYRAAHVGEDAPALAERLLLERGGRRRAAVADWRAGMAAPARVASLGQDLGLQQDVPAVVDRAPQQSVTPPVAGPRVVGVLSAPAVTAKIAGVAVAPTGTSVSASLLATVLGDRDAPARLAPTTVAQVAGDLDGVIPARLIRVAAPVTVTIAVRESVAATRSSSAAATVASTPRPAPVAGGGGIVASRLSSPTALARLAAHTDGLRGDGIVLDEGQTVLLDLPDGATDVREVRPTLRIERGGARVVVLGGGGEVVIDRIITPRGAVEIPVDARGVVVIAGARTTSSDGFLVHGGWHDAALLPQAAGGAVIGTGCVLNAIGSLEPRAGDARIVWTTPAALTGDLLPTTTTFAAPLEGRALLAVAVGLTGVGVDDVTVGFENAHAVGNPLVTTDATGASIVVTAITQDVDTAGTPIGPVRVNAAVAPGSTRDVTGVFAVTGRAGDAAQDAPSAARWLAQAAAATGLRGLDRPVSETGTGTTRIRWSER